VPQSSTIGVPAMSTATTTKTFSHVSVISIQVKDQDEAVRFYTECLGFEKRNDAPMGEGMRWVTVALPGSKTEFSLLSDPFGGAPLGTNTGVVLETDDIDAAFHELSSRGVHFTTLPLREFFGGWAQFVDQDGNTISIHSDQDQG
jgi:predicted enzyme related to lactoylglutathione lyase